MLALLWAAGGVGAEEVRMSEASRKAVGKGLEWLASKQNSDGSWSDGGYSHNTAITSFALLAFLSQGHLPDQGIHGATVARATKFLVTSAREEDGYLIGARGGNMYAHGMATLALAQLLGMSDDKALRPTVKRAVDLILGCQSPEGGWRYDPVRSGHDISATITQVMALRAARNAGIHVPDPTLKKAIAYIQSCYNPETGGYSYQPGGTVPGFARTAAGVCVLFLTGEYDAKEIPKAIEYLKKSANSPTHFYYGRYYAAHALHSYSGISEQGKAEWKAWYQREVDFFLPQQSPDGSWAETQQRDIGPIFQTSIVVITLSVPTHYLPIFQR